MTVREPRVSGVSGIRCPSCGAAVDPIEGSAACSSCGTGFTMAGRRVTWAARAFDYRAARRIAVLKSLFNPVANPYSPIVRAVRRITNAYYERTLSDLDLARRFRDYYLQGLDVGPGTRALDHGCGKGRVVGLLTQLGAVVSGQDIVGDRWWDRFRDCTFQVVSPEYRRLPWASQGFDVVLDLGVIEYLGKDDLAALASEVHRMLADGGHWVVWTQNPTGRGARARQSPHVHAPEAVERIAREAGFDVVSRRYDAVAFRVLPVFFGALRTIWRGRAFDYFSYGPPGESRVPDREKSKYIVIFRKTAR